MAFAEERLQLHNQNLGGMSLGELKTKIKERYGFSSECPTKRDLIGYTI